jgi:hypothetical protein
LRPHPVQMLTSFFRWTVRSKLIPQVSDPVVGLRVEARDAEIQRVGVERDAYLGPFRGRHAVVGIDLNEVAAPYRARPDRLVEPAVERDRLAIGQARGGDRAAPAVLGRGLAGCGRRRAHKEQGRGADDPPDATQETLHVARRRIIGDARGCHR